MGKYKLLAIDMDGTLLNDRSEISEENAQAIQKALKIGVYVCFSTGRGFQSALPYAEQLQLETPMITVNGGEIWHKPHVLYKRSYMNVGDVERLQKLAIQYNTWYWAYTIEKVYNKERWLEAGEKYADKHWLKFGFDTANDAARARIKAEVEGWGGLEVSNSSPTNLEVNPQGVSKATALTQLCELLQLQMSQVISVGDSLNDIAAIRASGLGIAMGNAQDEVKQAADLITKTNNEHAIARIIEQHVLGGG